MAQKPTEISVEAFENAKQLYASQLSKNFSDPVAGGDYSMAHGLSWMATGLRATYILLEQVKALLERQGGPLKP